MKKLMPGRFGEHEVTIEIEHKEDGTMLFIATCGETKRMHVMSVSPNHEYSDEQFGKDVEAARLLVAREAAGHEHTRLMRKRFFAAPAILLLCLFVSGCPKNSPTARVASVSITLPTSSLNCVTVRRNPKTNESETLGCTDSVDIVSKKKNARVVAESSATIDAVSTSVPLSESAAIAESTQVLDSARVSGGFRVDVAETHATVDSFTCPARMVVSVVETSATSDTLTCGGA